MNVFVKKIHENLVKKSGTFLMIILACLSSFYLPLFFLFSCRATIFSANLTQNGPNLFLSLSRSFHLASFLSIKGFFCG